MHVLVIGGGPAGVTAALRAAELGAQVTLVERGNLGGTCTNDGCVPTRVLARAARLVRDAAQYAHYGLAGEPPQADLAALLAQTEDVIYTIHEKKQLRSHLESAGVTVYTGVGEARFRDAQTLALPDGTLLTADRILVCVGGHARRLPIPGAERALTHGDLWRLRTVPRSLAVVGGAATGCQLASIFSAFGSRVTLLEVGPRMLGAEDPAISAAMAAAFTRHGIQCISGVEAIDSIEAGTVPGQEFRLYYRREHEEHTLDAEAIILAVGWPGNLENLGLDAAGVATAHGYVCVDETLRTSVPHIYGAGDITGRMMLVQSAVIDGRAAAEHALGVTMPASGRPAHMIIPHGGFTDPEYASVGLSEPQARAAGECVCVEVPYGELDRAVVDGHHEGVCKLIAARDGTLLGAHIVGEQAVEIVQVVAAGMTSGMRVKHLAALEFAYPTFTAILGLAARRLARELEAQALTPASTHSWHGARATAAEWERREPVD